MLEVPPSMDVTESRVTCVSQIDASAALPNPRSTQLNVSGREGPTRSADERASQKIEAASKPSKRKARTASQPTPSEQDDLPLDLPKELYKPRPSRSRSARVPEESNALSQSPVQSSRSRAKRSKTTTDSTGTVQHSSSEKLELICNMGFSLTQARNALDDYGGDIDVAIEQLLKPTRNPELKPKNAITQLEPEEFVSVDSPAQHSISQDSLQVATHNQTMQVAHKEPKTDDKIRKTTTKSAKVIIDSDEEDLDEDVTAAEAKNEAEDAKVRTSQATGESPEKLPGEHESSTTPKQESPLSKAKRSKSAPMVSTGATEDGPKPKKGRCRPRKDAKIVDDIVKDKDGATTKESKGRGRPRKVKEAVLQEADEKLEDVTGTTDAETSKTPQADVGVTPNLQQTTVMEDSAMEDKTEKNSAFQKLSPPSTPPQQSVGANGGLKNDNSPSTKGTKVASEHSPLAKGRVPYRVGLSRRVRIAPLLRVVKK